MAMVDDKSSSSSDAKVWGLFKLPFRNSHSTTTSSSSSNFAHYQQNYGHGSNNTHFQVEGSGAHPNTGSSVSSVARSLLPTRRRLKLDPSNKLYFPYEPGKQVRSAIKIKNTSKSYVAFKFDEHKDEVAVEQILRVVFLDMERPSPLAEAEAELEARKKPSEDTGPKFIGEGLVIDEWKERRERYLARQQVEGVDSI
ncbi:UNVERIFIED_CONTAM: Vesicle-associated protein 4-3 [Sesamum angustifolium]|uniref:Vesicle-associated protein 4-3 n=1 Tax=Sesamum angustifolium TaxID=2727405 RepID=A0AAW2KVV0_9LAMI